MKFFRTMFLVAGISCVVAQVDHLRGMEKTIEEKKKEGDVSYEKQRQINKTSLNNQLAAILLTLGMSGYQDTFNRSIKKFQNIKKSNPQDFSDDMAECLEGVIQKYDETYLTYLFANTEFLDAISLGDIFDSAWNFKYEDLINFMQNSDEIADYFEAQYEKIKRPLRTLKIDFSPVQTIFDDSFNDCNESPKKIVDIATLFDNNDNNK